VGVYWERVLDQKSHDVSGLFWWVDIMSRRAGVLVVMSSEVRCFPRILLQIGVTTMLVGELKSEVECSSMLALIGNPWLA